MVLVIYAHPYPNRSRANRALLGAASQVDGIEVRSLYDLYPDFNIDMEAEQQALVRATAVVWQHPMYWYSVPGLLKHWFDKVLLRGWAYGPGGRALEGKRCLWVTTTGGDPQAFRPEGMHAHPFESFVPPVEQTARFCHMTWEPPLVLHDAHHLPDAEMAHVIDDYRARLRALCAPESRAAGATAEVARG
ncbi:MAG: glutathione-regulated potassium-efflux system oxidoreductase KefF [Myxococcales bacterium]|nr:MAG: glutathione-regulated potassium-efflux system oxidoreductase KefF [Myxococcales bacterium]